MPENFKDLRILAVDDNKLNLIVLSQFLKLLGLTADLANGGAEALEKIKISSYELIFMDVHMPEIDGFTATKEIRLSNKQIIIFGLSADNSKQTITKSFDAGMNDYLTKPINKEKLIDLVQFYFGNNGIKYELI